MELHEIDVFIDKAGQVRLEVRGVKGQQCLEVTKALESALGGQVTAREMTAEAFESTEQSQQERAWQRGG
jgi:hypothetical protein